jgi:hypothetical protein
LFAPTELPPAFGPLLRAAREVADEQTTAYAALSNIPDALAEYLQRAPLTTGPLLNFSLRRPALPAPERPLRQPFGLRHRAR